MGSGSTATTGAEDADAEACAESACGALCVSCGDVCVNEHIDTKNCGGCGIACPAATICTAGTCVCPLGWVACVGPSGALSQCVPADTLQTDANNCGSCGTQCPQGASCQQGVCADPNAAPNCTPGGPGLSDCGPTSESCCTSPEVEGSTYFRTYSNDGSGPGAEADPASVTGFRLDKYLVTVGRFRQFAYAWGAGWLPQEGAGKHQHLNGGSGLLGVSHFNGPAFEPGWLTLDDANVAPTSANLVSACDLPLDATWTPSPGAAEGLPINCVTAAEAYAFCIWDKGFLPTEAEWECAAAGGGMQREYPWGSTAPGTANQFAIYDCYYGNTQPELGCMGFIPLHVAPVGTPTLGAGLWGQVDMAGEVGEWMLDRYDPTYIDPCVDCFTDLPRDTPGQAVRSAHFGGLAILLPTYREGDLPVQRSSRIGFRCARSP